MSKKSHSQSKPSTSDIDVQPDTGTAKPLRRAFPGPRDASAALRVAVERQAQADLIVHARESLEAEVCGVLVGHVCEDASGMFTHVEAIIRGHATSSGSTHVTFTQEAWTRIHETLDRDYPKLRIVGWYHTHPGFGVEFSDMDLFIQQNFFSGPGLIGMVTDPLSGAMAVITQLEDSRTIYLQRFWVDGRECMAQVPASAAESGGKEPAIGTASTAQNSEALESRVTQLTHAVDDLRTSLSRFLFTAIIAVCVGVAAMASWFIRDLFRKRIEPPQLNGFVQVPVKMGDKNIMVGVGVVNWEVPPELNSILIDIEKQKQEEAAKAAKNGEKAPGDRNEQGAPPASAPPQGAPAAGATATPLSPPADAAPSPAHNPPVSAAPTPATTPPPPKP